MPARRVTQKRRASGRKQMTRRKSRASKHSSKFLRVDSAKDLAKFEEMIKKGPLTITMVYLGWCGHCKKAEPTFREVAQNNYPGVNFAMLNGDLQGQTSIKSVKVEGVPEFVVSVPSTGAGGNSSVKVPVSYDKNTLERLATVSSNTVQTVGPGSLDPNSINANMTSGSGSPKPPPFLAINAPRPKETVKAENEDPEGVEMSINAVNGEEEEELEFSQGGAENEENTTTLKMNSSMAPPSASLMNNARRERKRQNLLTPAMSLSGEPDIVSPLNSTSPRAATAHLNEEAAEIEASLKKPMMIGGASQFGRRSVTDLSPVTVDGFQLTAQKIVTGNTVGGKKEKIEYSYTATYTKDGKQHTKKLHDTDIVRLVGKIKALTQQ